MMSAAAPQSGPHDGGAASMSEESTRTATPVHPFFLASGAQDGRGPVEVMGLVHPWECAQEREGHQRVEGAQLSLPV